MKNTITKTLTILSFCVITLLQVACDDDVTNPPNPNDEEVITTLQLLFTESPSGATSTFVFRDEDGDGGNPPSTFDTIRLDNGKTYSLQLSLLNEAVAPSEDITTEVASEGEDHQFFFTGSSIDNQLLTVEYTDMDNDGKPIGLMDTVKTLATGSGIFTVTLRHLPVKDAPGVSSGDITNAAGETDVEVNFPIEVQ